MKRSLLLLSAAALLFASCQSDPKADKATTGDAMATSTATGTAYKADLAQSRIDWTGTKPTGTHHGTMLLKDGNEMIDGNVVTGGKFDIDINSLKVDDQDTGTVRKLGGHLKSPSFFDAATYPTATFEITGVKSGVDTSVSKDLVMKDATHTVSGNLTMRGITKGITFPAKISVNKNMVTTDANFNIDRTLWGVNDEGLKDKLISPTVNIGLHIVANN